MLSLTERGALAPSVPELAEAIDGLAKDLGERHEAARRLASVEMPTDSALARAMPAVRMVATDIMVIADVDR